MRRWYVFKTVFDLLIVGQVTCLYGRVLAFGLVVRRWSVFKTILDVLIVGQITCLIELGSSL